MFRAYDMAPNNDGKIVMGTQMPESDKENITQF
jgi:hypothetical protein